jgi:hypothetical protein
MSDNQWQLYRESPQFKVVHGKKVNPIRSIAPERPQRRITNMIGRHIDVDSLLHPLSRVEPDIHVILHSRPNGENCFQYEDASEKGEIHFLAKQVVHESGNNPNFVADAPADRLIPASE